MTARQGNLKSLQKTAADKQAACTRDVSLLQSQIDTKTKENSTIANLKYRLKCHWAEIDPSVKSNLENATIRYDWKTGDWSACSTTCGNGAQTRTLSCQTYNLAAASNDLCTRFSGVAPATSQSCNLKACPVDCQVSAPTYGNCIPSSGVCGAGTQSITRTRAIQAQFGGKDCLADDLTGSQACTVPCPRAYIRIGVGYCSRDGNNRLCAKNGYNWLNGGLRPATAGTCDGASDDGDVQNCNFDCLRARCERDSNCFGVQPWVVRDGRVLGRLINRNIIGGGSVTSDLKWECWQKP